MSKIEVPQFKAKPTISPTPHGKKFEKKFSQTMNNYEVDLTEVDNLLEKEQKSLKKQIWDLAKMEALVHSDPKLSGVYNDMAEDGEEKYGYHYNETIMNIIFNDYVLNNPDNLTKYKNAVPVEKKRRDKSGINQLQDKLDDGQENDSNEKAPKEEAVMEEPIDNNGIRSDTVDANADREYLNHRIEKAHDVEETTGAASSGAFTPALGKNHNVYEGKEKEELEETTDSSSSGQYSTPWAFAKGQARHSKKPMYPDGEIIGENYFTDTKAFKKLFESLDSDSVVAMAEHHLDNDLQKIEFITNKIMGLPSEKLDDIYRSLEDDMGDTDEGILTQQSDTMAINGDNPTTMAATMKNVRGNMGEGEINERPEIEDNNPLKDFGQSNHGLGGSNGKGKTLHIDGIKNSKADMSFGMTMNDLTEDGHCRKDEVPVVGKIPGDKGSCEKKEKKGELNKYDKDNKFNVDVRKKREQDYQKRLDQKEKEKKSLVKDKKKNMEKPKETVSEDKRPSALVMLDRLKKDNMLNFNVEMKDSNSADLANGSEKRADDEYSDVGDPQKLSQDIEKEKLEQNKGESFENVGNSTNDNNKEIPKRNKTENEQEMLAMDRGLGMQDIVYDNEPDERFEERMKKDMGEDIYKLRRDKMDYRKDAPMYNKDTQPTDDEALTKVQHEKNKSKFGSDSFGHHNESVTGRYEDISGFKRIIDFKLDEAVESDNFEGLSKINLDGLGNTYTAKIEENVSMRDVMNSFDFYFNHETSQVVKAPKGMQRLSESENKEVEVVNESFDRMKKLMGYDPSKYVNTHNVKKNRKF